MRSFIAVDFNKELKNQILALQSRLRGVASSGRWKLIDNFHLTLKFLGEVEKSKVQEINTVLEEVCSKTERFYLNIEGLSYFPGNGCLRVLWLKLSGDLKKLEKLQSQIDSELEKLGVEREKRRYVPHVTIAQDVIFNVGFEEIDKLAREEVFSRINVESVCFFKSEQIGRKRVYTPLTEHELI